MYAPKSPLRKGSSFTGGPRSYQAPTRTNTGDSSVNPIPIIIGQLRTAADQYEYSPSHAEDLSRSLVKLSGFYLAPKLPETDVVQLVDIIGSLTSLSLPVGDICMIARFVSRSTRTELPNLAMFKASGMKSVFEMLLSDLCRILQLEHVIDGYEHVCDVLLGLSCIMQYSSDNGWLGKYRQYTLRALLLLHSRTLSTPLSDPQNYVTQLKLQVSIIETLGYAYSATADSKVSSNVSTETYAAETVLLTRLASIFPGLGASEYKLSAQVLELLVTSIHTSQLYLKALPSAAVPQALSANPTVIAIPASNAGSSSVLYHTTAAQLALLVASLRAAHLVFDSAQSVAKLTAKKGVSKVGSALVLRLNQRNSLLTSVESLLKDSVNLLSKRLALVTDNYALYAITNANSDSISTASATTPTSTSTSSASPIKSSAFARAAYRPPSQRNNAVSSANNNTTNPAPLATPPGFGHNIQSSNSSYVAYSGHNSNNIGTNTGAIPPTTMNTNSQSAALAKPLQVLREQVTQMGLTFLGSLAAHDPVLFLLSWKNFLGESQAVEDALESKCNVITSAVSALISSTNTSSNINSIGGNNSVGGLNAPSRPAARILPTSRAVVQYSPILYHMLRNTNTQVRAAAVNALLKLLTGIQLGSFYTLKTPGTIGTIGSAARSASTSRVPSLASHKAKSDDAGKFLQKIASALIVSLNAERHEGVVEVLCKLSSLLLNQMPLSKVLSERQVYLNIRSGYELQAVTIYHLLLKLSVHFEVPCVSIAASAPSLQSLSLHAAGANTTTPSNTINNTSTPAASTTGTTSAAEGKPIFTSTIAMAWVTERCKGLDQTQAFAQALQLPYLSTPATTERKSNLHSSSISTIGRNSTTSSYTNTGADSTCSQVSYIYAAVYCLLRAIPPGVMNNMYCITVRTLNTALAQYHPALYVHNAHWLYGLLSLLETHAQPALRLQGSKMLFYLLEYDLKSIPTRYVPKSGLFGMDSSIETVLFVPEMGNYVTDEYNSSSESYVNTYDQCKVVGRSVKENIVSLYRGCVDDAHIVRTQAMLTLGALSPYAWRVLHGVYSPTIDTIGSACSMRSVINGTHQGSHVASVRVLLLRCLLTGTTDTIGTVRAAAYKSLGDCVVHLSLLLSAQDEHLTHYITNASDSTTTRQSIHSLWSTTEEVLMRDLMCALGAGLADTKLSVRIQAAWALGNVLINVLPYRWSYLKHSNQQSPTTKDIYASLTWLQDESWIKMYHNLLPLLKDSDKMLATAVRCVGNTIAGMYLHYAPTHTECIHALHRELILQYLVPEYEFLEPTHFFDHHLFANVKDAVLKHSQKLIFALSQTLGFVLHSSISPFDEMKGDKSVLFVSSTHISEVIELQLHFLRHGKLKIQLQAVQVLLYAVTKHQQLMFNNVRGDKNISSNDVGDEESNNGLVDYVPQLVRLLECLFVLTRTTLSGGISTKQTSSFSTHSSSSTHLGGLSESTYAGSKKHTSATGTSSTDPVNSVDNVIEKVLQTEQGEEETRAEVVQLFRSRATQLLHYFVLLLHNVVGQLWQVVSSGQGGAETTQAVLELLVFYGEDVTVWMSALQPQQGSSSSFSFSTAYTSPFSLHPVHSISTTSGSPGATSTNDPYSMHSQGPPTGFTYSSANTTVGLPHVHYDVAAQLQVQGKTPQTLVAETCANLLRFTLPITDTINAGPSDTSATSTSGNNYRPERLPYALVARLESLAQYAPSALQSLYLDAYSGTDGVRSALSGMGSSTYGVFDGLDYQNLFVPSSPPRQSPRPSPHKLPGEAYDSSSKKLGAISEGGAFVLQEAEDDEF